MIHTVTPYTLRRTAAPAALPVSLSQAKDHLRVTHNDEDGLIDGLIAAAVSHFDGQGSLGRAMISQEWQQSVSQAPGYVRLQMGPFISLTSIQYYDTDNVLQTANNADFETWLDGDFVTLKPLQDREWPNAYVRPDAIRITYRAGYGASAADVPQGIKQAILMTVAHWYEHRMAVDETRMVDLPFAVEALIGNERATWYG